MTPRTCSLCGQIAGGVLGQTPVCPPCRENPARPLGIDESVIGQDWRAYRITATELGYTPTQPITRAQRARFDRLWTWYLYLGALVNGTYVRDACFGPAWDEAKDAFTAGHVEAPILALLKEMP